MDEILAVERHNVNRNVCFKILFYFLQMLLCCWVIYLKACFFQVTAYITRPSRSVSDSKPNDSLKTKFTPNTECKVYDTSKKNLGIIGSYYSGSQTNVNCITMHKIRWVKNVFNT